MGTDSETHLELRRLCVLVAKGCFRRHCATILEFVGGWAGGRRASNHSTNSNRLHSSIVKVLRFSARLQGALAGGRGGSRTGGGKGGDEEDEDEDVVKFKGVGEKRILK